MDRRSQIVAAVEDIYYIYKCLELPDYEYKDHSDIKIHPNISNIDKQNGCILFRFQMVDV